MSLQAARDLFLQNKYEESLSLLKIFLHQSNEDTERIEILELILKIKKILKLKENVDHYIIQYGCLLGTVGRHSQAIEVLWPLLTLRKEKHQTHLVILWESLVAQGELGRAEQIAQLYLDYLLRKKNASKAKHFIMTLNNLGHQKDLCQRYEPLFGVIQGDLRPLENFLEQEVTLQKITNKNIVLQKQVESIIAAMDDVPYWDKQYVKKYFQLVSSLLNKSNKKQYLQEKFFVSTLFEYIVLGGNLERVIGLVATYAVMVKRRNIARFVLDYRPPNPFTCKDTKLLIETLESEIESYTSNYHNFDSADYGTDLLREENLGLRNIEGRIKQLEFEIKLLLESKKTSKAIELMREISELDPEHAYAKEYYEHNESKLGSTIVKSRKEVLTSIEKLQAELAYLSRKTNAGEVDNFIVERTLRKSIDLMSDGELRENGKDIIVALISLDFFNTVLWVLEKDKEELGLDYLDHQYLKITTYFNLKKYYQVSELVDDLLKTYPMLTIELHSFLYLKAEALREMGRRRDAQDIYKKIYKENPNYRMVFQRLNEVG